MKRRRDGIMAAMLEEIERAGGTVDSVRPAKGGHSIIYWTRGECRFASTVARTNGNHRQEVTARTQIRRMARLGERSTTND